MAPFSYFNGLSGHVFNCYLHILQHGDHVTLILETWRKWNGNSKMFCAEKPAEKEKIFCNQCNIWKENSLRPEVWVVVQKLCKILYLGTFNLKSLWLCVFYIPSSKLWRDKSTKDKFHPLNVFLAISDNICMSKILSPFVFVAELRGHYFEVTMKLNCDSHLTN